MTNYERMCQVVELLEGTRTAYVQVCQPVKAANADLLYHLDQAMREAKRIRDAEKPEPPVQIELTREEIRWLRSRVATYLGQEATSILEKLPS